MSVKLSARKSRRFKRRRSFLSQTPRRLDGETMIHQLQSPTTKTDCIVCERIKPSFVFKGVHETVKVHNSIYKGFQLNSQQTHDLAVKVCTIINEIDREQRILFCGRPKAPVVAALLYIIGCNAKYRLTQREVSHGFDCSSVGVGNNFLRLIRLRPKLKSLLEGRA